MNDSSTTVAKTCYVHEHLSPALHGFLDVCRALSKGNGRKYLYFSGETMADHFHPLGISTAYAYAKELVSQGWLKVMKASYTLPNGRKSPTIYLVLDHDQWAAENPGACARLAFEKKSRRALRRARKLVASPLQNLERLTPPLQISDEPLQNPSEPLQISDEPLQNRVDNSYLLTHKNQPVTATDAPSASPDSGVVGSFFQKHLSQADRKRVSATKLNGAATTPDSGAGVSNTVSPEQAAVADIINSRLRMKGEGWKEAIAQLSERGISPDRALMVFNHRVQKTGEDNVRHMAENFVQEFDRLEKEMEKAA